MIEDKKVVAIIPARGGSKGIPNKNIIQICGKPLIAWTIEQAQVSKYVDYTFVTTDSDQISNISLHYGAKIINRPTNISSDTSKTEEALVHAIRIMEEIHRIKPDIVVLLQPTSPLRKPGDIDNSLEQFLSYDSDSLFSVTKIADLTLWQKNRNQWESVNFDYKNKLRRQDRPSQYIENGSIYITKPELLIQDSNVIGGEIGVYEQDFWQTWEIDTMDEVDLVEFYLNKNIRKSRKSLIKRAEIELIVFDFDGVMTDNTAILMEDGSEGVIVNRADGVGVSNLKKLGIPMVILTSEANPVVKRRAEKLKLEIISNIDNKKDRLSAYLVDHKIDKDHVIYVGNDLNDLEVMQMIGFPVCPADSHPKIVEVSKLVLDCNGGEGVSRAIFDILSTNS